MDPMTLHSQLQEQEQEQEQELDAEQKQAAVAAAAAAAEKLRNEAAIIPGTGARESMTYSYRYSNAETAAALLLLTRSFNCLLPFNCCQLL